MSGFVGDWHALLLLVVAGFLPNEVWRMVGLWFVSGIDEGLWTRLPGLAPGQAIVSFPHMTRPLLVSVDPAPAKLRLVD